MLSNPQKLSLQKLYAKGSSPQDRSLTDDQVRAIIARTAADLSICLSFQLDPSPEIFSCDFSDSLSYAPGISVESLYEELLTSCPNAETYVSCIGRIVRARLKYSRVLETQPLATMDQVGPRSLLQFGLVGSEPLASLLVWRKWLFDIDNRAAQDTGYLFEPVIAGAIGGLPYGHKASPIRRLNGSGNRQVDAIKGKSAYEFKIRITIAASGQGRWREELSFPEECVASGYKPILIVLDPTTNPKLDEISNAYRQSGGDVYIGDDAWEHLRNEAGSEMGLFLAKYVELPIKKMVEQERQRTELLPFSMKQTANAITMRLGVESIIINRLAEEPDDANNEIPDDAGDFLPGVD